MDSEKTEFWFLQRKKMKGKNEGWNEERIKEKQVENKGRKGRKDTMKDKESNVWSTLFRSAVVLSKEANGLQYCNATQQIVTKTME